MLRTSLFPHSGRVVGQLYSFLLAAGCLIGLAALPAAAQNLLTNPGFENGPGSLYPGGVNILVSTSAIAPYTAGYTTATWGAENGAVINSSTAASVPPPSPQVINPNSGSYMLDMIGAGTNSDTQAWQLVDVTAYQTQINAGGVTANLSAYFNAPNFVNSEGLAAQPGAQLDIQFYSASYLAAYGQLNDHGVPLTGVLPIIAPNSWTQVSLSSIPVPAGTSYILAQVGFANKLLTNGPTDYDAYVDDANLTLSVPEPASVGMLATCAMGVLGMRRRKAAANG